MKRLKKAMSRALPQKPFARGVSILVGGTASAQLITLLAAPLLTRLYSPEDFGMLAIYSSLLALISVLASLRYELAIPLPKDDLDAANVAALSLLLVIGTTLLSMLATLLFGNQVANLFGVPALAPFLWLLPIAVLLSGIYTVFSYYLIRTKRFGTIAGTKLRQSLATVFTQLAAFNLGGVAMLLAQVVGQSIGALSLARPVLTLASSNWFSWRRIIEVANRYKRFPIYSTWEGLFNTAGGQLPPLMLAALFSPVAAGLYSMANRILNLPMALIGQSIGQVFYSNAAEAHRVGMLGKLVSDLHSKLAHIGSPPALLLILLGPELFSFVFGPDWLQAGEFSRWMTPWLYLVFVSSPFSTLFAVTEKLDHGLAFQAILLVTRVLAILVGGWLGDLMLAIILFSSVSALCWFGFLFWVAHTAGSTARSIIMPTLGAGSVAVMCALPVLVAKTLPFVPASAWPYSLLLSMFFIAVRYLFLLRNAY